MDMVTTANDDRLVDGPRGAYDLCALTPRDHIPGVDDARDPAQNRQADVDQETRAATRPQ